MGELGEGCFQPFPSTDIDTCEGWVLLGSQAPGVSPKEDKAIWA